MPYCTKADCYLYTPALRSALRNPGRPADSASASDDTITLDVHGFVLNDKITLRPEAGGSLPRPLVQSTIYFALPVDEARFQLADAADGSAIDLTTDGARIVIITPINFDAAISWASAIIDDQIPAHAVPLVAPYPLIVVMTCAELAGGKLLGGSESQSLSAIIDFAIKRLARWATGIPLRGANTATQQATQISVSNDAPSPRSLPCTDREGWGRFGGL